MSIKSIILGLIMGISAFIMAIIMWITKNHFIVDTDN